MKVRDTLVFLTLLGWPAAHAADQPPAAVAQAPLAEGEVRKVDKAAGKLTIRHGPLENLGMPPMTMVFRVRDAAMLDQVKPGDRIQFLAEKIDGAYTVTKLSIMAPSRPD